MYRYRTRKRSKLVIWLVLLLVAALGIYAWRSFTSKPAQTNQAQNTTTNQTNQKPAPEPPKEAPNLQPVLDAWLAKNTGTYSVVMRDLGADQIIASTNENKQYFMASLYKLYVAYLGYMDIQKGLHSFEETFLNTWTRQKCLDEMIRTSHSPCGEKYMAEQDRAAINERIKAFDATGTTYGAFVTTARDMDLLLSRVHKKQELNDSNTNLLLESMKGNIYRDALVKGVPEGWVVADKVGFRELVEYHDVAIIYMPDGSAYALSILTQNAGSRRIADLTRTLLAALPQ